MDDQTLIKAFLKKQKEIQDDFITRLEAYKAPVDTVELKRLVEDYKTAVYGAANIKPKLDTSTIDLTIKQAVSNAVDNVGLVKLTEEVKTQARAIECNNSLLSNGTGLRLKYWVLSLTLAFGVMIGWSINWYFEIPDKIAGVSKYQTLQQWYDFINETMRKDCKLAKEYYKDIGAQWNNQCGTYRDSNGNERPFYPLKTSQELIRGD